MNTIGINERMKVAETMEELDALITEAQTYAMASKVTMRKWRRTYAKRSAELAGQATSAK